MDPHGFQMTRAKLEDIFPTLPDVATSSVGASIEGFIAEQDIGAPEITKAFLATRGMERDGLGARVVQSKHTGRWRGACKEIFNFVNDKANAATGRASTAFANNPHFSDMAYESTYDRNLLLYAMLEIKLSFDKDSLAETVYSTLTLFDTICGSGVGGYRVPDTHNPIRGESYSFQAGYELDTFAPIVNYGSLETLQSTYMTYLPSCQSAFAPEDMALHAYCNMQDRFGSRRSYFALETNQRAELSPFAMQRDRLCSASWEISIEDTLAKLPQHTDNLFDTPERDRFRIDYWIVPAWARGEEVIHYRTMLLSMRSFVYITSSNDPSVAPGLHRLIDLPVFKDARCGSLPGANCAPPGLVIPVNTGDAELRQFEATSTPYTGRQLMRRVRCSQLIEDATGQTCDLTPYASRAASGCYSGNLMLLSRPVMYSSRQWMRNLVAPPPLPPPQSPSPPPPFPLPPSPDSPPSPPYVEPQTALMERIRDFQEQACTSVYYLSTAARCERLAVQLTESVLYQPLEPPSSPPAQPTIESPPPPSSPPTPNMPSGISSTPISSSRLSTIRVPTVQSRRRLDLYSDGYYMTQADLDSARAALATADQGYVARCTPWQSAAPLPCVSGAFETNCISGRRHCGSDASNSDEPTLELWVSGSPRTRSNRLWGFEIELPQNEELASLFFKSADQIGGLGYRVNVFKQDGSGIPCQTQAMQVGASGVTSDRRVQHVCASGGASDDDLFALMDAYRVTITLTGTYRQLWIKSVTVYEISVASAELPPRPPNPPPLPVLPPTPPTRPSASCTFHVQQFLAGEKRLVFEEPCGLSFAECCNMAHEYGSSVNSFEMDDAGCCKLLHSTNTSNLVSDTTKFSYLSSRAGTGLF